MNAPAALPARLPLALSVVLHTVLMTVRGAVERATSPGASLLIERAIGEGDVDLAYATLANDFPEIPKANDTDISLVNVLLEALASAKVAAKATATPPRRFHAKVALLGHRELGVCLVTEDRLAGAGILRADRLDTEVTQTHWFQSTSVYLLEEMSDADAGREIAEAHAARMKKRAFEEQRARELAARGPAVPPHFDDTDESDCDESAGVPF